MIDSFVKKQDCCGCMLRAEICPVNAIEEITISTFSYPKVNESKCINCKKCINKCPVMNAEKIKLPHPTESVVIASNKSLIEKERSTSGGVFIELASEILRGGVPYTEPNMQMIGKLYIGKQ